MSRNIQASMLAFATVFGFLLLDEVPTGATFVGGFVIIISVIAFSLRGTKNEG